MSDEPSNPPMTVLPIEYSSPVAQRPGLVTTIGVLSIVVGTSTILANLFFALLALGLMMTSRQLAPAQAAQNQAIQRMQATQTAVTTESHGYRVVAKDVVVSALNERHPLSELRKRKLEFLITMSGKRMLPFDESRVTRERVLANISDAGSTTAPTADATTDYFVLGEGRLEISDREAVFRGPDFSATSVLAMPAPPVSAPAAPRSTPNRVRDSAAAGVLAMIESLFSVGLAIYLLVIGVGVMRGSPSGATLHYRYICMKLPLALFAMAIWAWLWMQIATGSGAVALAIFGAMIGFSGALYPIGLNFALRSSDVREYYRSVTPA